MNKKLAIALVAFLVVGWAWNRYREVRKRRQGVLAVVHVYGPIRTSLTSAAWGVPDADEISQRLHRLSKDKDVKAVLLRINSPGGTVGGVQEIHREILRCKLQGKKIVASLGDVAASGGYYLASAADSIVAEPGTITGSIGVILQFGNLEGFFQKVGLKLQVIKSGEHKDIGSPARLLTAEEKRMLQTSIDDAYRQFVEAVREGRKLSAGKVKTLADGRIFTGRQALALGLVDELGNKHDAFERAIRLAQLPAEPYVVSDRVRSFSSLLREASSRLSGSPLESLQEALVGPLLEYRWLR